MTAEEFVLIPELTYIREQPHASQVLLNSSIKHKKAPVNLLEPQETSNTPEAKLSID